MSNNIPEQLFEGVGSGFKGIGLIAFIFAGVLASTIGVATPIIFKYFDNKGLSGEVQQLEGQVIALNTTMGNLSGTVGGFQVQIVELKGEREELKLQVAALKQQLESEVKIRQNLSAELDKKETRIKELETLLAKLTDGKYDSFDE